MQDYMQQCIFHGVQSTYIKATTLHLLSIYPNLSLEV